MKASVGVKRLLMYALVLLCILFVGFLAYFFARNDEKITFTLEEGSVIYKNISDEPFKLPIVHEDPHKDTKIEVVISDENLLNYVEATQTFTAVKGGMVSVTLKPTNKDFGPYRFDILIGDGSVANPWYVSDALQLSSIGTSTEENAWDLTDSYELINDINLQTIYTETEFWTPIGSLATPFEGKFNGNGYTLNNLKINGQFAEVGLFGALSSYASVEGIKITNAQISSNTADAFVGLVAGVNRGTISRVIAQGNIISNSQSTTGGIVGKNDYDFASATLSNASANVAYSGTYTYLGGVVGQNNASVIFNCKSVLNVDATINQCFGGIVALNNANNLGNFSYTRPIVKNCYTMIDVINNTQKCGLIVGNNQEVTPNDYGATNLYVSNYGYALNVEKLCFAGKDSVNNTEMQSKTKEQLQNEETFSGWAFGEAWIKDIYPEINIEATTTYHNEYIPGSDLVTKQEVENAVKSMVTNPDLKITYTIDVAEDITIDCYELLGNVEWTPIGSYDKPFNGQIIVKNNKRIIFTNIKITENFYENAGFFGFVKDAYVENITVKDVNLVNNLDRQIDNVHVNAGAIAGTGSNSVFLNCNVENASIKNYTNAGFVLGQASSNTNIENCAVSGLENSILNEINSSVNYGGTVGLAFNSKINNCLVDSALIKSSVDQAKPIIGGIVGNAVDSEVSYCSNLAVGINSVQSIGYYGGIVGTTTEKTTIEKSYSTGNIEASAGGSAYAGGITASTSKQTIVKTSFSRAQVQAKYVGGLVANNTGTITECYSDGEYRGYDLGGFAYKNTGEIYNCYTVASVVGLGKKDNVVAGMVAFLPEGGNVTLCFSTAAISGKDSKLFAETSARIRYTGFENFFDNLLGGYKPGTLTNCVVVNYGDAKSQKPLIFGKNTWIECTDDDCRSMTPNNPFEKAEFNTKTAKVWDLSSGQYPTLINCITEPQPEE